MATLVPLSCAQGSGDMLLAEGVGGAGGAATSGKGGSQSVATVGPSATGGPSATSGPSGTTGSGSGPSSTCDGSGDCNGCQQCAQQTSVCSSLYEQCSNSYHCSNIMYCWGSCQNGDENCQQQCLGDDQQGDNLFTEMANCVVCACVEDCSIDPTSCP